MSMPSIFMEDTYVGGIPWIAWSIRKWLPQNKRKREYCFRIQMVVLTYVTYSLFNMARRPIALVKTKIMEECHSTENMTTVKWLDSTVFNLTNEWCNDTYFEATTEEFVGFMDAMYVFSYGICLYISGIIADCYNPRFYLTAGCFLSGFFCALLGLAYFWAIRSFKYFGMVLILFGISQSTGWPVVLSCVTHWYSGGRRGMFFGFWNTHNYLGSVLGIAIAGAFVDRQWGWAFCIPGFILAFMGLVVFLCMVADPGDLKELDKAEESTSVRKLTEMDLPPWLGGGRSITMYDAWTLPGVIEFSACMFFSRIAGYIFFYFLPRFAISGGTVSTSTSAHYSGAYVIGASLGGIVAGILVDISRRSAFVCTFFLLASIPVLLLGQSSGIGKKAGVDYLLLVLMGLFVEAPYIVTSTTVSANLGTHRLIKRNHRALSTIGGIVEGTGAIGASIGICICSLLISKLKWSDFIYIMVVLQLVAALCLSKQAYKDFHRKEQRTSLRDYWAGTVLSH